MVDPIDSKTVRRIPRGGNAGITLKFNADTIKITEEDKTKKAKKVSIRLTRDEAEKIWEVLYAKRLEGCFSETSQAFDSWDLYFEERQV